MLGVNSKDVPIYLFFSYSRYTVYVYVYLFVIICICFLVLTFSSFICYLEMLPLFSNQVDISKAFVHCNATPKLAKLSGCS